MSSKLKNKLLFSIAINILIFDFLSKPVLASKSLSNPPKNSDLDSRPIFDIFLDVDGTSVFGFEEASDIPKSLESFKVGNKSFVVTPYFKDFLLSLVNDT